jgi:hypothetical protein
MKLVDLSIIKIDKMKGFGKKLKKFFFASCMFYTKHCIFATD